MQIKLAEHAGFCRGVSYSVNKAREALIKYGRVYYLHPLIHNKIFMSELEKNGLIPAEYENLKKGDAVIISAHGESPERLKALTENGVTVIDATCPFLKKIHDTISEYDKKGYEILLFGNPEHAEIKASKEYGANCRILSETDEFDFSANGKYLVLTQTTYDAEKAEIIKEKIKLSNRNLQKTVVFFDSICYTTLWRQVEAANMSKNCSVMLVVGDKTSANSVKLFEICKRNCPATYFISNVSDLKSVQIENKNADLGIVSGASTPKELIMEVFYIMSETNTTEQNVVVTEATENTTAEKATVAEESANVEETKEPVVTKEPESMAEAMKMKEYGAPAKSYREGMRINAKVISVDPTGISVAIEAGGKNDSGFIAKEEAELDGSFNPENYKVNDPINCIIIPKDPLVKGNNTINLSKKAFDQAKLDDERVQKILAGEEFTLSSTQEVKGGLLGKIGSYTVFVPASQIRIGYVKNLADYTNKTLRLVALPPREELDENGNPKKPHNSKRIVASQRVILEKEKAERDDEFWSHIYEGAIVNGKVKRFTTFGAFVSLKYMDALVHCTDLSWSKKRVTDPSEILEKDKNYDFIVLNADRENGKISLGYKQLQKKPYEIAQEKYPIGSVVEGKVARIVPFGAFVELEPGIDGLVHISQIKHGWIENAAEVLKEGQDVKVKVMNYDDEKITLSIKALLPEEEPQQENSDNEERTRREDRSAKFGRRFNREDRNDDNGMREYVSDNHKASFGDLFAEKFGAADNDDATEKEADTAEEVKDDNNDDSSNQ
jgi:4-hydroxy-3-methylbut-2-enyl diphosphate reductase